MRRYWLLAGVGLLIAGLAVGAGLAAMAPGGFGGPGQGRRPGGGPGPRIEGPGPGPVDQGPGPGGQRPGPLGPPLIRRLEEASGNPLTDEQRQQVLDATKTFHESVQAAHRALVQQIAQATGLTVEQVRSILPPPPPPPGAREGTPPPPPPPPGAREGSPQPQPEGQAPPQGGPRPPRRGPQPPQPPADK